MTKVTIVSTFRRPVLVTTKKSGDGPRLCRMGMLPIGMLRVVRLRRRCRSTPTWGLWNMIPMGAVRQRVRKWESSMRKVKRRGERMRSTLIRLPRRLRQDVAVGLVAAAVFSGLAACHAGGTRSSAHGSASTAGALDGKVPSNVEICNLLPAGEFEEHAGAQRAV